MNCKHIEELLPLYVGHDLETDRFRLTSAHVQTCTECGRSAAEYEKANQLLQHFDRPQFSEATYAAVRKSVLCEIEGGSGATTWVELLRSPFQPRVVWAVSTAVLLAVCAFAYYFVANRASGPQNNREFAALPETADGPSPRLGSPVGVPASPAPATASPKTGANKNSSNEIANDFAPASIPQKPSLIPKSRPVLHSAKAGGAPAVQVESTQYSAVVPPKSVSASVTAPKTLRLEIQTKDPSVRIIWFSSPSTREGSPIESSKGI